MHIIPDHGSLQFTLQGFERLTKDAMGTLTPLSDEFELCGLPWYVDRSFRPCEEAHLRLRSS